MGGSAWTVTHQRVVIRLRHVTRSLAPLAFPGSTMLRNCIAPIVLAPTSTMNYAVLQLGLVSLWLAPMATRTCKMRPLLLARILTARHQTTTCVAQRIICALPSLAPVDTSITRWWRNCIVVASSAVNTTETFVVQKLPSVSPCNALQAK